MQIICLFMTNMPMTGRQKPRALTIMDYLTIHASKIELHMLYLYYFKQMLTWVNKQYF